MLRKPFKAVFAVLFVFTLSSAASALPPEDALSARPADSVYTVARINDLNRMLQKVLSPANIEMMASMVKPEDAQSMRLVASFAAQIPAKSVALASGMTADKRPFLQVAVSMPPSVRPKLNRVADGSASGVELVTLLFGDGGMMLAAVIAPEVQKGSKGPYYTLKDQVAFAAKDDLLLIASSPAELEASLDALEKKENRLSYKRRFDSPNYWHMHMDMHTLATFAEEIGGKGTGKPALHAKLFKAPLEFEIAFSSRPKRILLSASVNILESVADFERYKDMRPEKGANLFLAGGGKLLFALSTPLAFKAEDLKVHPNVAAGWSKLVKAFEKVKVSERDLEDLLNVSFSLAWGSEATILGKSAPGGYLAFKGRKGAAAKILGKLADSEALSQAVPMAPLKADGWDSLFAVDPTLFPVPLLVGVVKDSLFIGVVNSTALAKAPELPTDFSLLEDPLFGVGFIDTSAIWNWTRQELADPDSHLSVIGHAYAHASVFLKDVLEADLAVPLIKIWSPELETSFMELSVVNVPEGKRLLPRLLKLAQAFVLYYEDDTDTDEWLDDFEAEGE